jgi:hypothetical protein
MAPPTTTDAPVRYRIDARRLAAMEVRDFGGGWHGGAFLFVRAEIPARYGNHMEKPHRARLVAGRSLILRATAQAPDAPHTKFGALTINPRGGTPYRDVGGHFLAPIDDAGLWIDWDLIELAERLTLRRAISGEARWRTVPALVGLQPGLVLTDVDGKIGALAATHLGPGA